MYSESCCKVLRTTGGKDLAHMASHSKEGSERMRLDRLLVDRGYAQSRERAQALILAGRVLVDEQRVDKPGTAIRGEADIRMLGSDLKYVSRGGLKLERALAYWSIDLTGRSCVDIGASTGGFTDCMLQHGAMHVLAVDTGYGQIAQALRSNVRVTLRERTNARLLRPGELVEALRHEPAKETEAGTDAEVLPPITFLCMDVSFISATLVLPPVLRALSGDGRVWVGEAVVLVKPQFEAGREHVGKGGIVRDPAARTLAIERVQEAVLAEGGMEVEVIDSPIHGMEGNHEYLLHARFPGVGI